MAARLPNAEFAWRTWRAKTLLCVACVRVRRFDVLDVDVSILYRTHPCRSHAT